MRIVLLITLALATTLSAQPTYAPARYASGSRPPLPALAVGGGQAFVEVAISPSGTVEKVTPLRSTPPFTKDLVDAVGRWRFTAAADGAIAKPVASKALVAALFRAPTLLTPTLGEQPATVASAADDVAFPLSTREPGYPPQAAGGGVVLIEAKVDATGKVIDTRVIGSAPPFDAPALEAARQWRFRPARIGGRATASFVYLIFGFPAPVTGRR